MSKWRRIFHWVLATSLLPSVWATTKELSAMVPVVASEGVKSWWMYLSGGVAYFVVERFVAKPMWIYVLGHEMTHAISGLLSGARIYSFKAVSKGGEVRLSKSNGFIALSPYIVPFYAVSLLLVYAGIKRLWNPPYLLPSFQFLLGMAMALHVSLTIDAFHYHQPDLKVLGFYLSGVLILLGNTLILGFLGVSLFRMTPTISEFSTHISEETARVWKTGFTLMQQFDWKNHGEKLKEKSRLWIR